MPVPSDSTSLDQSREDNSPRDAQHGIAAEPDLLWKLHDNIHIEIDGEPATAGVVIDYGFMDGTNTQKDAVRNTIETRRKPAGANFVTWEDCANVRFHEVEGESAQIRITFRVDRDNPSWSAFGRNALNIPFPGPTMALSVPNEYPPSEVYRGIILHEFGHALGLHHEHQSPTFKVELEEKAVNEYYKGDKAMARSQVLDKVQNPTNYTRFDKDSIMVYTIPRAWQKKNLHNRFWLGRKIVSNNKLSELDQAFIRLMYPPDLSKPENVQPFLLAMRTAGVPEGTAGRMLNDFLQNNGSLDERLTAVRNRFNTFRAESVALFNPNQALLRTIDPKALRRSGVNGFIGETTKNKLFQAIVKNLVHRTMEQNGIPTKVSLPGSTQNEVMRMLGALAMHDGVGHSVKYYDGQLSGKSNVPSYDPRDDTLKEETPQNPDSVQPDPRKWVNASGSATAYIKKDKNERVITVDISQVLHKKALLTSDESSLDFNHEDVDVKGSLYYNSEDDIDTGTKARWTLEWIVFYHDQWDSKNFTACFIPEGGISRTNLRSKNEVFDNVEWQSI